MPDSVCLTHARVVVLGLVLAAAPRAQAQRGVDVEPEHLALHGMGIFAVERAETTPAWGLGFQLLLDYTRDPLSLTLYDPATQRPARRTIMNRLVALHLGLTLGLTSWLELGVEVPV